MNRIAAALAVSSTLLAAAPARAQDGPVYTFVTNGFKADGSKHDIVASEGGVNLFKVTLASAYLASAGATVLRFSSVAYSYTSGGQSTTATAGVTSLTMDNPTTISAGAFSCRFNLLKNQGAAGNYVINLFSCTVNFQGSTISLPPGYGTLVSTAKASGLSLSGSILAGGSLTGSYTYADSDGLAESGTVYQWYRNLTAIANASSRTYTVTNGDVNQSLAFCVRPSNTFTANTSGIKEYCTSYTPIPSVVVYQNQDLTGTMHAYVLTSNGCFTGVAQNQAGASHAVIINGTTTGSGVCTGSDNLLTNTSPSYASDVTSSVSALIPTADIQADIETTLQNQLNQTTTATLSAIYSATQTPTISYVIEGSTISITG